MPDESTLEERLADLKERYRQPVRGFNYWLAAGILGFALLVGGFFGYWLRKPSLLIQPTPALEVAVMEETPTKELSPTIYFTPTPSPEPTYNPTETSTPTTAPTPSYTLTPTPTAVQGKLITIYANQDWQPAGVWVNEGDQVVINYVSGIWTINYRNIQSIDPYVDADGYPRSRLLYTPLPDANDGALIGRIGTSSPFSVGNHISIQAFTDGELSFRINDEDYLSPTQLGLQDNQGSITMQIEVTK